MGTDNTLLAFAALGFLLFSATCIFIVYEFRKAFSSLEQDIALLDVKVNFLFQQENKRFLESIGKTPKHHKNAPESIYCRKVASGEIDPAKVSLLDFYRYAAFVPKELLERNLSTSEDWDEFLRSQGGNPNLPKMKNPPPPPPLKPKKPTR